MAASSLSERMKEFANPVAMLRKSKIGMYVYPVVAPEFTNWRDEQRAWRDRRGAVRPVAPHGRADRRRPAGRSRVPRPSRHQLVRQLRPEPRQALRARSRRPAMSSATTSSSASGEDKFILVGRAPTSNWLMFCAAWGKWNVRIRHDPAFALASRWRAGAAHPLPLPDPGAGRAEDLREDERRPDPGDQVLPRRLDQRRLEEGAGAAPRHVRRAGAGNLGPLRGQGLHPCRRIMQAARDAGVDLVRCGSRAYSTNTLESGWIPSPLPGIYTGDGMLADYRDWLGADSYEAAGAIGGSFVSRQYRGLLRQPVRTRLRLLHRLEEGRLRRQGCAGRDEGGRRNRKKVTFEWNPEDVLKVIASAFEQGTPYKWIDFPQPNYASSSRRHGDARTARRSACRCSTAIQLQRDALLSLGVVDADSAEVARC